MVRSCKRLWTKNTTEWFLSCMSSWMCFQMVSSCIRLWTESTTEWFLSCMNSGMNTESWWIPEGFITHWTPEASLWMTSQMNLENVWCRKRLCTLGTTMKILSCSCYFISEINVCQTICLRLLVQKNFIASAPTRKITSIHIQVHVYQHCSPKPFLNKAHVWGTDTILHIT
jgi:hypothetical protein